MIEMFKEKTKDVPLPSGVNTLERPKHRLRTKVEYKTICSSYDFSFDTMVNNAVEEGWKLEKRFINSKGEFVAFMIRETWEEQ